MAGSAPDGVTSLDLEEDMTTTWILVADASRAVVLATTGTVQHAREVHREENPEALTPEAHNDRMGHMGHGNGGHALAPHTTHKENVLERFASKLVAHLEQGRNNGLFQKLIVVAPPKMLGSLRNGMGAPLRKTVTQEHPRDVVGEAPARLREHLETLLA